MAAEAAPEQQQADAEDYDFEGAFQRLADAQCRVDRILLVGLERTKQVEKDVGGLVQRCVRAFSCSSAHFGFDLTRGTRRSADGCQELPATAVTATPLPVAAATALLGCSVTCGACSISFRPLGSCRG